MNTLPTLPSQLIRLAIDDLKKVMADPSYKVSMASWHWPTIDGEECAVCLAGAVMAKTLHADKTLPTAPRHFGDDCGYLLALDWLRSCNLIEACNVTGNKLFTLIRYRAITQFEDNPDSFIFDMLKMADDYELAEKKRFRKKQKNEQTT